MMTIVHCLERKYLVRNSLLYDITVTILFICQFIAARNLGFS